MDEKLVKTCFSLNSFLYKISESDKHKKAMEQKIQGTRIKIEIMNLVFIL